MIPSNLNQFALTQNQTSSPNVYALQEEYKTEQEVNPNSDHTATHRDESSLSIKSSQPYEIITSPHQLKSESEYLNFLEEAEKEKEHSKIVDILEKLGQVYFLNNHFLVACKIWNAALAINDTYVQESNWSDILFEDLAKAENSFISHLVNKKLSFSYKKGFDRTVEYRARLSTLRRDIGNKISTCSSEQMPGILKTITAFFIQLTADLIADCIKELGQPPCQYAIVSMGSMSREEASLFSDLEFAILIDKDILSYREYFRNLTRLIHLKVINLGETNFPILHHGLESPTVTGFCFDSGGNTPLGKEGIFELIGTPEQLADFVTPHWFDQDVIVSNAISNLGFIMGDPNLLETYEKKVKENLDKLVTRKGITLTAREHRALLLIRGDIQEFKPNLDEKKEQSRVLDIKKELYRFPNSFLNALAIFYDLKAKNSWGRLQELFEKGLMSKEVRDSFGELLEKVAYFRVETHLHYGSENEKVFYKPQSDYEQYQWNAGNYYILNDEDLKRIRSAFQVILPIYQKSIEFCDSYGQKQILKEGSLKDNDAIAQAKSYILTNQLQEAKKLYLQALALDPTNLEALGGFSDLLMALSEKKQAVQYLKKSLAELERLQCFDAGFLQEHPQLAEGPIKTLNLLGSALSSSDPEESLSHFERAQNLLKIYLPDRFDLLAEVLVGMSQSFIEMEQWQRAIDVLAEARCLYEKNSQSFDDKFLIIFGSAMNNLGYIYSKMDDHSMAIECLTQSVHLASEFSYVKGIRLVNLGNALAKAGMIQDGISKLHEALTCQEKFLGKVNPDVGTTLSYLGNWYNVGGDYKKSLFYFKQELYVNQALYGFWDKSNVTRWNNLAEISVSNQDFEQASIFYQSALEVKIRCYGKNAQQLATTYDAIQRTESKLGRYKKCVEFGEKGLAIIEKTCGKNNNDYMMLLNNFSQSMVHIDAKAAIAMALEVLTLCQDIYGKSHQQYGFFLMNLGAIYRKIGDKEKAISQYQKAYDILAPIFGLSHNVTKKVVEILEGLSPGSMVDLTSHNNAMENILSLTQKILEKQGASVKGKGLDPKALFLINRGDISSAISYLEEKTKEEPQNIAVFIRLGKLYESRKEWDSAQLTYAQLLFNQTDCIEGYYRMSYVFYQQEEIDKARLMAKKCLGIDPSHSEALQLLQTLGEPEPTLLVESCDVTTILEDLRKNTKTPVSKTDLFYQLREIIHTKTGDIQSLYPFDVNLANEKGVTLLHIAAEVGNYSAAEFLVNRKANINLCDKQGHPPIFSLCLSGEEGIFDLLIKNGAKLDFKSKSTGTTVLHEYTGYGHLNLVKKIIELKAIAVDSRNATGCTPLYFSAQENYPNIVEYLIEHGANVNAENDSEITPLMVAASQGNSKIIEILAKHKAKCITLSRNNSLFIAIQNDQNEAAKTLVKAYPELLDSTSTEGMKPHIYAIACGNHQILAYLLEQGLNPKEVYEGANGFEIAINEGHLDVLKILYPFLNKEEIFKCLFYSVGCHQNEIFDWLLPQIKESLNTLINPYQNQNAYQVNILLYAGCFGTSYIVQKLLESGLDPSIEHNGRNILHMTVHQKNSDVLAFLVKSKLVPINACAKEEMGFSALMVAVVKEDANMVQIIVDGGGDINQTFTEQNFTPIHLAVLNKNLEVIKALLSSSESFLNTENASGNTPLDIARSLKEWEIYQYLCEKLGISYSDIIDDSSSSGEVIVIDGNVYKIISLSDEYSSSDSEEFVLSKLPLNPAVSQQTRHITNQNEKPIREDMPLVEGSDQEGKSSCCNLI